MSTKHVRTVADLVRFGAGLRVECRECGAARSFDGYELAQATSFTGSLVALRARMLCQRCGHRDAAFTVLPPI